MTALVLVEFAEDIPVAIRRRRADPEQVRLIALTPEAAELLEAQAQPYAVPFEPDDIPVLNKLAMENLSRTLALSEWVSARLSALKPELNAIGFEPVRCHFHEVFTLFNAYAIRIYALRQLLGRFAAEQVIFFRTGSPSPAPIVFQAGESVWSEIGDALQQGFCMPNWAKKIRWEGWPSCCSVASVRKRNLAKLTLKQRAINWVLQKKSFRTGMDWLRILRALAQRSNLKTVRSQSDARRLLVIGSGTDIRWVVEEARAAAFRLTEWPNESVALRPSVVLTPEWAKCLSIDYQTNSDEGLNRIFQWDQVDWRPAMRAKWNGFFLAEAAKAMTVFQMLRDNLKTDRPTLVLHGEVGHQSWLRTRLEAARSLKVPTAFYQWGGGYGYYVQPFLETNELQSDLALVYTPHIAEVFTRQVANSHLGAHAKSLSVGSPYFAHLRERTVRVSEPPLLPKKIFFLPENLGGAYWYGPNWGLEDNLRSLLHKTILRGLVAWGRLPVVLKLHPSTGSLAAESTTAWLEREHLPVEVKRAPLSTLLRQENLWVIEHPSTVFQEILVAGGRVVYVNTRCVELYPEAEEAVRAAALVIDGWASDFSQQLSSALDSILAGWMPNPVPFLTCYVHSGEHRTARRVAHSALETILQSVSLKSD